MRAEKRRRLFVWAVEMQGGRSLVAGKAARNLPEERGIFLYGEGEHIGSVPLVIVVATVTMGERVILLFPPANAFNKMRLGAARSVGGIFSFLHGLRG